MRWLAVALCTAVVGVFPPDAGECATGLGLRPIMKETYPAEDTIRRVIPPNVFFLLDTGSPMSFSPNGAMPMIGDGKTSAQHMEMFREATYGSGARPTTIRQSNGIERELTSTGKGSSSYSRFGRDLDRSNNIIGNPNCYYTPYEDRPYFLTFRDFAWANWNGQGAPPRATTGMPFPPQLLSYLPGGINEGQPVVEPLTQYLVPNDSKMYQMKLVLWRILTENADLLSKMKVAMGTSYFETNFGYTNYMADFYKNAPYDAKRYTSARYGNMDFQYGAGPGWTDELLQDAFNRGQDTYADSQGSFSGIDRNLYESTDNRQWGRVNRAVMHLPFDYLYTAAEDGAFVPQPNLSRFLEYIDGVETVNGSASGAVVNREFFADGKTPLSTAIYGRRIPGRPSLVEGRDTQGNPLIRYASQIAGGGTTTSGYLNYGNTRLTLENFPMTDMTTGSPATIRAGQAVGSVIDFFSPLQTFPFATVGTANTVGYFPVTGSCQKNWLVVFTAANDSEGLTADEAVRELFNESRRVRGRMLSGTRWMQREWEMDSGIRTLVVGFVDPDPEKKETETLRNTLTAMAQWGDPVQGPSGEYEANEIAHPFFGNDVPNLIASLKAVLQRINADRYASSAPAIVPQAAGSGAGDSLYSPSYVVVKFDQWEGWFTKYRIDDKGKTHKAWEVNELLKRDPSARRLYTVTDMAGATETSPAVNIDDIAESAFAAQAGIPADRAGPFRSWLRAYDKESLLGDMEHGGYVVVGEPGEDLGMAPRKTTVYLQTNRGFLHAIDDETGGENWAFMPPNILQGRAQALKFMDGMWLEAESKGRLNSLPTDLLDGGLVAGDVRLGGAWHSLLLGNLGWGGNGIYAMDVGSPAGAPKFLWAIDNARYGSASNGVKLWGEAAKEASNRARNYDYGDLGLTVVSPSFLTVAQSGEGMELDVGILPGGLGYALGNDNQGKAFYVFNPSNADIIKRMTQSGGDFVDTSGGKRSMGMMVAPVTYVRNAQRMTTAFYTADSNGNLLVCDTERTNISDWKLESVFQLLASDRKTPISVSKALAVADAPRGGGRWLYAGTADLMVPDSGESRRMENPEQYIVGVNTDRLSGEVNTYSKGMFELNYERDDIEGSYGSDGSNSANTDAPDFKGWFMKLRPPTETTGQEYVTTSPYLYNGVLFVSTFIPKPPLGGDASMCDRVGDSKLYAFNPSTGAGLWNGRRAVVLKNVKIAGMSAFNGQLYIGVKPFSEDALDGGNLPEEVRDGAEVVDEAKTLLRIDAPSTRGDLPWDIRVPYLHYWKDVF